MLTKNEPGGPTDLPPSAGSISQSKYKKARKSGQQSADQIVIDPDREVMPSTETVKESKDSTAVFTFGRFNPPTVGHEKLIHKVESVAKEHGGKAHIFASHSQNTSKDPLPQEKKIGYLKKVASSNTHVGGSSKESPNFLHIAKKLHQAGHQHLVMVAGSDRVNEYKERLNKYNGHPDHYNFKSIKVVSAGHRDPDAEGVEGMSGTKMRSLAREGKHKEFKAGLPKSLHPHAEEIASHIRSIKENLDEAVVSLQQRIKRALAAKRNKSKLAVARKLASKRMAGGPQLKRRAQKLAKKLLRIRSAGKRGAAYNHLSVTDKIALDTLVKDKSKVIQAIAKRIIPRVKQREVQRLAGVSPGSRTGIPMAMSYELEDHYRQIINECGLEEEFMDSVMAKILAEAEIPTTLQGYKEKNTKEKQKVGIPAPHRGRVVSQTEGIDPKDLKALQEKAEQSGVPLSVLKTIFARGISAAKSFKPTNSSAQQQAFARINSFIKKGKSFKEYDKDLAMEDTRPYTHIHTMAVARGVEKIEKIDVGTKDEKELEKKAVRIRHRHGQIQRKVIDEHKIDPIALSAKIRAKLNKLPKQTDVDKLIHNATKDVEERIHRSMEDEYGHSLSKREAEED